MSLSLLSMLLLLLHCSFVTLLEVLGSTLLEHFSLLLRLLNDLTAIYELSSNLCLFGISLAALLLLGSCR